MIKYNGYYVGDFETTVYEGQTFTEVWASAIVELGSEDVIIHNCITDTFNYLKSLNKNIIVYYHNLKFDGQFWLSYLISKLHFKQSVYKYGTCDTAIRFDEEKDMENNTFIYSISDMGAWYSVTIKVNNHFIQLRDSLKLLPFSVKKIGKSFGTKHKKLDMEYTGYRFAGGTITPEEQKYIANDVLVVKEALEIMFLQGHKSLTIGSCCMKEYKKLLPMTDMFCTDWDELFPDLKAEKLDKDLYGSEDVDRYIRNSYHGGWCYVAKGKERRIFHNGTTADVNSLYPSMMSSESGNYYPVGLPKFWRGDYIPQECFDSRHYFFVRIRTRFYLKPNKLPCIQIKGNPFYRGTEWLETSDIFDKDGNVISYYKDVNGNICDTRVTLTLTQTDYQLIKEHYELADFEILDGCYFRSVIGLFDIYIDKYKKIKMESTGAIRELAKLFLNNLYGKMATSNNSSFKYAYEDEDGAINYVVIPQYEKQTVYIPVGTAITSYARNFTIRTAQKNYYGVNERGFIYADTDSIHCDLLPDELVGVPEHPTDFCHWKLESCWETGYFTRQKTYIEYITHENREPIEHPFYSIKCAGMPERCKNLMDWSMQHITKEEWETERKEEWDKMTEEEKEFVLDWKDIKDFNFGLVVPSKLVPKRIVGGIVLKTTTYEMRDFCD